MLPELCEGLLKWYKEMEHAYERLECDINEFNENGVYSDMGAIHERNAIFRIYFDVVVCHDVDLDDRAAVLAALKDDRVIMQDFVDIAAKNMIGVSPNDVYCAEQALRHYDELINKIEVDQ